MDFQQAFLEAIIPDTSLSKIFSTQDKLPKPLCVPEKIAENLSYIQAFDSIHASYPYHYEIAKLDSFCLLYTESGSGLLTFDNRSYILCAGTIAFIYCIQRHRIEIRQSPWVYKIFFISGTPVSFFYSSFIEDYGNLHSFLIGTSIPDKIFLLIDLLSKSPDKSLIHARTINDILFELLMEKSRLYGLNCCIRNYIYEIKHDFDYHYIRKFSLAYLEQKYHISKYQICREFTRHFHISPIHYLNRRKIEVAKELLLSTDKKINEIGRTIGFENPNNFIRQFKKHTGTTPLKYRRRNTLGT